MNKTGTNERPASLASHAVSDTARWRGGYSTALGCDFKHFVPAPAARGIGALRDVTMSGRSYLDHNATTPVRPEVAEAMLAALQLTGNPSSVHGEGRAARAAIEQAREQVAALCHAKPANVVFTSGGTEANTTVLSPGLMECSGGRDCVRTPASLLLYGATEHACVRDGHRFSAGAAEAIPVDAAGLADLGWLKARLERLAQVQPGARALIALHLANNETGVIQPLAEAAAVAQRFGALLHCDAVQAAGKIAIDINALGADVITLSAHKLGGPKGVGAIVFRTGACELADKPLRGGGQERGWRAGTENVPGIVGFGVAATVVAGALAGEAERLAALRDRLEAGLSELAPDTIVFGRGVQRLPNTSAFATPGIKAETALIMLDLAGIALSSGSACSSGKVKRSHVLDAMRVDPAMSAGALRASLGWTTSEADIADFLAAYAKAVAATTGRSRQAAA